MEIIYNYTCKKVEAYTAVNSFWKKLESQYDDLISNFYGEWNSLRDKMQFRFSAKGFKITGDIQLADNRLILNGNLPLLVRPFKGKVESIIKKQLEESFS